MDQKRILTAIDNLDIYDIIYIENKDFRRGRGGKIQDL